MSFGSEMGESPPLTYGEGSVVLAADPLHTKFGPIVLISTHFSGKYLFSMFMHIFWALQFRCSLHLQLGHEPPVQWLARLSRHALPRRRPLSRSATGTQYHG